MTITAGICIEGTLCSFFFHNDNTAHIKPDNRPERQVKLSSEDDFDDWDLQWYDEWCCLVRLSCGFRCLPPSHAHSVSTLMGRYKMWPLDVRLEKEKKENNTLFMCFQFHLRDSYSPWSRPCSLSLHVFLTLPHFSVPIFNFYQKKRLHRPPPQRSCAKKIIITHI